MKTSLQHRFPQLQNPYLSQLLPQLISRYSVVQLFYTPPSGSEYARLIIHLQTKREVEVLQSQPWVRKLQRNHNTFVHFFYSTQLHSFFKSGHPFVLAYCRATAVIYANGVTEDYLHIDEAQLKKQLKKFKAYKAGFYHDHELLRSQIQPLVATDCDAAVLFVYENLLGFDLEYLEALYLGMPASLQSLHERITALIPFVPQIQQYFVKGKGNGYYLTALIEKAKEASLDAEWYFADENQEAFRLAEAGLYDLITQRFRFLNYRIKGKKDRLQPVKQETAPEKGGVLPEGAVVILSKIKGLEEVYLFHECHYGDTQTFYLLLVGRGLGNAFLKGLTAKLKAAGGNGREFVLIGHTRQWIQEWLYSYQSFFKKGMSKENLLFTSSPYHPAPHWEAPYTAEYPDLKHSMEQTEEVYNQFLYMADCDTISCQGVAGLFSLFFLCFCRTYIYARLSYYPHWLHSYALWQLCLYARPDLKRYEYLFKELGMPFFEFLDSHRTVRIVNALAFDKKRKCLLKIAEGLMGEVSDQNHFAVP